VTSCERRFIPAMTTTTSTDTGTGTGRRSSPTPQWDSRNLGFIPPAQLQILRQSSPLAREISSEHLRSLNVQDSLSPQSQSSLRPSLTTSAIHTRSSSLFSFLKSNDNTPATSPSRRAEPGLQQQQSRHSDSDELGRRVLDKPHPPLASPPSLRNGSLPSTPDPGPSVPNSVQSPTPQSQHSQLQSWQSHPEIRSIVNLTHAHAHKIYMSGPLIRRIERLPDGHQPIKDEGWRDVWAQLGGTTLSIWDMKEIENANKQGKEVPPTYINVTDAVGLPLYHPSRSYLTSNCCY
jgi:CCR4-NOT transcriptional complex subunit CAF120